MRIVFMGTPDFALAALQALHGAGHEIACVYSQPPRPAGRGHKERPSRVQAWAEAQGLTVRTPRSLKDGDELATFAALDADVAVVAAYGLILPRAVLAAPRHGCINIHASLLPRWRGAAPIQRAILAGDRETGITIMRMDEGLDTGPILLREAMPIDRMTAGELHDALAVLGARLIVDALGGLEEGMLVPEPQPAEGVTYAAKIGREEARIDWRQEAEAVERQVRAFAPRPGAWFEAGGKRVKVLTADVVDGEGTPGEVLDDRLTVACGRGALRLVTVQREGKAPSDAEAFLRGFDLPAGTVL